LARWHSCGHEGLCSVRCGILCGSCLDHGFELLAVVHPCAVAAESGIISKFGLAQFCGKSSKLAVIAHRDGYHSVLYGEGFVWGNAWMRIAHACWGFSGSQRAAGLVGESCQQ